MKFGISMEGASMLHIGDAGNIASGMFEAAAKILQRNVNQVLEIGGVWKFDNKQCDAFFDVAKEMQMGNKDSSMFWSSLIHASTHNTWCRISFFKPEYEIGYLQDALEQSEREYKSADEAEYRFRQAAGTAYKEREAAQRHVKRLQALIEVKKNG